VRAATRSWLRVRARRSLVEALAAAVLAEEHAAAQGVSPETETTLFVGLQAAEDVLGSRLPDLLGDVPACAALACLLYCVEPHDLVFAGALAVLAGAVLVVTVGRTTSRAAHRVWEALIPAMEDLSTAIHARLELVGNGGEGLFLQGLSQKVAAWETRSRGAAGVSFFAGRAPVVAAAGIVGLFLLRRGWGERDLAAAVVIASVTPAFASVARGALDLGRDLVSARAVVLELAEAQTAPPNGTVLLEREGAPITWEGVSLFYPGQTRAALDGVNVTWSASELLGLAGPNGSGKSTFLRLLLALHRPSSGRVAIGGRALMEGDRHDLRQGLGFLPQRPFLPDQMEVGEAIRLLAPDATPEAARATLTRLAVWSTLERRSPDAPLLVRLGSLSAGEKQRVAIARVLLRHADTLVLDEPDANLDARGIALVAAILREESLARRVIFVAHHPDLLAAADRVIRFEDGRVVAT
jgi:ABC-type transport system involved in cytochrome bd biosynthesis fused ATPase/permease subunit